MPSEPQVIKGVESALGLELDEPTKVREDDPMMSFVMLLMLGQLVAENGGPRSPGFETSWSPSFEAPKRLRANGELIRVEEPGFACPSWVDLDGDGEEELVVGQLKDGRMRAYPGLGGQRFGPGNWLQAEGDDIITPGVW